MLQVEILALKRNDHQSIKFLNDLQKLENLKFHIQLYQTEM